LIIEIIAQFSGAIAGAFLSVLWLSKVNSPYSQSDTFLDVSRDLISEALGTFIFVCAVLIMRTPETSYNKENKLMIFGVIAFAFYFSEGFASRSGGYLNPALSLGLELVQSIQESSLKYLTNFYVYLIGPLLGCIVAPVFFLKIWKANYLSENEK
jgi:glycerol uptake facilitator-like aquaporin